MLISNNPCQRITEHCRCEQNEVDVQAQASIFSCSEWLKWKNRRAFILCGKSEIHFCMLASSLPLNEWSCLSPRRPIKCWLYPVAMEMMTNNRIIEKCQLWCSNNGQRKGIICNHNGKTTDYAAMLKKHHSLSCSLERWRTLDNLIKIQRVTCALNKQAIKNKKSQMIWHGGQRCLPNNGCLKTKPSLCDFK